MATTVAMPLKNNWVIGTTLDSFFDSGKPSPFTRESLEEMENAFKMSVPLDVEMGIGENWLEAH